MTYEKHPRQRRIGAGHANDVEAPPDPGRTTLVQQLRPGAAPAVQRKETGAASTQDPHATASEGVAAPGASLPFLDTIQRAFGAHDVTEVEAHTGGAAERASAELGAKAYAFGNHVAFAGAPDLHTAAHEAAHVVQQRQGVSLKSGVGEAGDDYERHADAVADRVVAGESAEELLGQLAAPANRPAVQRREINPDADYDRDTNAAASMTVQDWLRADRVGNTRQWQDACLTNLLTGPSGDASQYKQIEERRDFYLWFYNAACARGYQTRWMLAAYLVANGAHQVANMDATRLQQIGNALTATAPVGLQAAMRQGNQLIFDNVMPKLRRLWDGGPLTGQAALQWDMQTLAEEQALVQPMYNALGSNLIALNNIAHQWGLWVGLGVAFTGGANVAGGPNHQAGTVPAIPSDADITQPINRWRYGMSLGNQFAPSPTGYTDQTPMPAVDNDYQMNGASNAAFDTVNTRPNLHALEAYLNPLYIGDRTNDQGTADAYFATITAALTPAEKQVVLADRMPDGSRYSTAMGQLGGIMIGFTIMYAITDDEARACLPADASPAAVDAFLANLHAVQSRNIVNPMPPRMGMGF